jgi:hypothetical protein
MRHKITGECHQVWGRIPEEADGSFNQSQIRRRADVKIAKQSYLQTVMCRRQARDEDVNVHAPQPTRFGKNTIKRGEGR